MPRPSLFRRRPLIAWSIVVGALATVAGVTWGLMAKSAAEQSALFPDRMPTLPVHEFVQYTQRAIVPDYTGLWIGLVVAALGAAVLLSGAIAAFARPRTA